MEIIGCKWVFKTKLHADGALDLLKSYLVTKGFHQVGGVNYNKTLSPTIKIGTI